MTKTLSVGVIDDSKINYITFCLHSNIEMESFCDNLALYIVDKYSDFLIKLIINKNYAYFERRDKAEIYKIAQKVFTNTRSKILINCLDTIKNKIYNYISEENAETIVLDGFANFRLGEYVNELELLVDYAVEEYFTNLEYENFISLLKELIIVQRPLIKIVHIRSEFSGRYFICDENFKELTKSQLFRLIGDDVIFFENEDDFLLSTLISIAPKKIIMHLNKSNINKNLIETLAKIFEERIVFCNGCEWCKRNYLDKQ